MRQRPRDRGEVRGFPGVQQHGRTRAGREVERAGEVVRPGVAIGQRAEPPVLLDELQRAGVVQDGVVDLALARIRADEQGGNAETRGGRAQLGRPHAVVPSAGSVIGPHERGTAPVTAEHELRDHRPDQALAEGNRPRGALVIAGRGRHVRDRGQRPGLQILVVLVQADDVAGERRVVGEPVEVDQGHPGGLGLGVGRRRGLIRLGAVVALDVELPAHAGRLEPVEDRQLVP